MILANDLKKGDYFGYEGSILTILDTHSVKPGKGGAFCRLKVKNIENGKIFERTLRSEEKVESFFVEKREARYMYDEQEYSVWMDLTNYEEIRIEKSKFAQELKFIRPDDMALIQMGDGKIFNLIIPDTVDLKVVFTENAIKGDTVNKTMKVAELEQGIKCQVPLFVATGDTIRVDTKTNSYITRV